jgi:hypothetical protein
MSAFTASSWENFLNPGSFTDPLNGYAPYTPLSQLSFGFSATPSLAPGVGSSLAPQPVLTGPEQYYVVSQVYKGIVGLPALYDPRVSQAYSGGSNVANYAILFQIGGTNVGSIRKFSWSNAAVGSAYAMLASIGPPAVANSKDSPFDFFTDWDSAGLVAPTYVQNSTTSIDLTVNFNGLSGGHTPLLMIISTTPPTPKTITVAGLITLTTNEVPQIYGF